MVLVMLMATIIEMMTIKVTLFVNMNTVIKIVPGACYISNDSTTAKYYHSNYDYGKSDQ